MAWDIIEKVLTIFYTGVLVIGNVLMQGMPFLAALLAYHFLVN